MDKLLISSEKICLLQASVEFLVNPPCFATDFLGREAAKDFFWDLGHLINEPPLVSTPILNKGGGYCDSRPAAGRMSFNKEGGYCVDIL